jgi:hypothetical protein
LAALAAAPRSNAIIFSQSSNRSSLMPVAVNKSDAVDADEAMTHPRQSGRTIVESSAVLGQQGES